MEIADGSSSKKELDTKENWMTPEAFRK